MTVDSLVNQYLWKDMLDQLIDEWKEFTLYVCYNFHPRRVISLIFNVQASVLLNANVAFLAIQSVDSSGYVNHRSNAQRASYFSMANSIAAIVLGLLLVRGHNTLLGVRTFPIIGQPTTQLTETVASLLIFYLGVWVAYLPPSPCTDWKP
jgi:hypothetical protein